MFQIFIIVIIINLVYTLWHKTQIHIQSVGMFVHSSTTQKYHRLKKGVFVSVFVTVTSRKPEYPQTEL